MIGDRGQNARTGVGGLAGHEHIDEYHYELTPSVHHDDLTMRYIIKMVRHVSLI